MLIKTGKNHSDLRSMNLKLIIDSLLSAPETVSNLAAKLELSYSAVIKIVNKLIQQNVLIPLQIEQNGFGRPAQVIDINPDCLFTCIIDLSQRKTAIFFVDAKGFAFQEKFLSEAYEYNNALIEEIIQSISNMRMHYRSDKREISNIHIVTPPKEEMRCGDSFLSSLITGIKKVIPTEVYCDKDVIYAINGENKYGALNQHPAKNAIMLKVDKSISLCVMLDGAVLRGEDNNLGAIANSIANIDCSDNTCADNTLHHYAALRALRDKINYKKRAGKDDHKDYSYDQIFSLYGKDTVVNALVDDHAKIVARICYNYACAFGVSTIILCGGVINFNEPYLEKLNDHITTLSDKKYRIIFSQLGDYASLRGAIWQSVFAALTDKVLIK